MGKLQVHIYFSLIMPGFTNYVCMSPRMLYLSCVKIIVLLKTEHKLALGG